MIYSPGTTPTCEPTSKTCRKCVTGCGRINGLVPAKGTVWSTNLVTLAVYVHRIPCRCSSGAHREGTMLVPNMGHDVGNPYRHQYTAKCSGAPCGCQACEKAQTYIRIILPGSVSYRVKALRTGVIHHAPVPMSSGPRGVMNHARTNDPLPFLPCFTSKDGDPPTSDGGPGSECIYRRPLARVASFRCSVRAVRQHARCPQPAACSWLQRWRLSPRETSRSSAVQTAPWSRLAVRASAVPQRLVNPSRSQRLRRFHPGRRPRRDD